MSRYIAVIFTDNYGCYDCEDTNLISHITDWTEVTDEEFTDLISMSQRSQYGNIHRINIRPFRILERPQDERAFILRTIAEFKPLIEKERLEREKKEKIAISRAEKAKKKREAEKNLLGAKKVERLKKELERLTDTEVVLTAKP